MQENLLVTIKANSNSFTRAERSIANYVLSHTNDVPSMSIAQLAAACQVGETSVFRLCKVLGKTGYQDFKMSLAHSLGQSLGAPSLRDCIVGDQDSVEEIMQKVLNNCISVLYDTYRLLDAKAIITATRWLVDAKHLCFFGVGSSAASAQGAQHRFLHFCPNAEYIADPHLQTMRASSMSCEDVGIFFSCSGSTKALLPTAQAAKKAGAKIIGISRFSSSPLAEISDLLLVCGGNEGPYQPRSMCVRVSQHFLMELLCVSYCMADAANYACRATSAMRALWDEA